MDWHHRLAPRFCYLLNEAAGNVSSIGLPSLGTFTSTSLAWVPMPRGPAVRFDTTGYINLSSSAALFELPAPFSVEAWWVWDGVTPKTAYSGPIANRVAGQNGFKITGADFHTTDFTPNLIIWNGSAEASTHKGTTAWTPPFDLKFLFSWDGSTAHLYVNGIEDSVGSGAAGFTGDEISIGRAYDNIAGNIVKASIWPRVISDTEARELHAEPYAFLRPILRRRYSVPAAGGAAVIPRVLMPPIRAA